MFLRVSRYPICLSVYICVCRFTYVFVGLHMCLSVYICVCRFTYVFVGLHMCL